MKSKGIVATEEEEEEVVVVVPVFVVVVVAVVVVVVTAEILGEEEMVTDILDPVDGSGRVLRIDAPVAAAALLLEDDEMNAAR